MPHAETSTHCGAARNLQFRRNAVHGVRIVSLLNCIYAVNFVGLVRVLNCLYAVHCVRMVSLQNSLYAVHGVRTVRVLNCQTPKHELGLLLTHV